MHNRVDICLCTVLFCSRHSPSHQKLMECLRNYELICGEQINKEKSYFLIDPKKDTTQRDNIRVAICMGRKVEYLVLSLEGAVITLYVAQTFQKCSSVYMTLQK